MLIENCDCAVNCGANKIMPTITLSTKLRQELIAISDFPHLPIKYVSATSGFSALWECTHKHQWKSTIRNRTNGTGCPYCSGKKAIVGETDFKTLEPIIASEWDYEDGSGKRPENFTLKSNYRASWQCNAQGHKWTAVIADRVVTRSGCPYCSRRKMGDGINGFPITNPELFEQWDEENNIDLNPHLLAPGSKKKVGWKHFHKDTGVIHRWKATILSRVKDKASCSICSNMTLLKGFNDFAFNFPALLREWDYDKNTVQPDEVIAGTHRKVWWLCVNGHSWEATVKSRAYSKTGCGKCKLVGTSKIEQVFHKALSKRLDVVNGSYAEKIMFSDGIKMQVDIFGSLRNKKVAIEYDGCHYHGKKVALDTVKTQKLLDEGYHVVRIREKDLEWLPLTHPRLLQFNFDYYKNKDNVLPTVGMIVEWITNFKS